MSKPITEWLADSNILTSIEVVYATTEEMETRIGTMQTETERTLHAAEVRIEALELEVERLSSPRARRYAHRPVSHWSSEPGGFE